MRIFNFMYGCKYILIHHYQCGGHCVTYLFVTKIILRVLCCTVCVLRLATNLVRTSCVHVAQLNLEAGNPAEYHRGLRTTYSS